MMRKAACSTSFIMFRHSKISLVGYGDLHFSCCRSETRCSSYTSPLSSIYGVTGDLLEVSDGLTEMKSSPLPFLIAKTSVSILSLSRLVLWNILRHLLSMPSSACHRKVCMSVSTCSCRHSAYIPSVRIPCCLDLSLRFGSQRGG